MFLKWIREILVAIWQKTRKLIRLQRWKLAARSFPRNDGGKVSVHIGCGEINIPDFINIDARKYPHVHIVSRNIADLSIFPDESADLVYMCHVFEHIKRDNLPLVLKEMRRILKPCGVLRLSVPDFDRIIEIYQKTGNSIDCITKPLMGGQDYEFNFHYTVFNRGYLHELLLNSGFKMVREWVPLMSSNLDFEDWASRTIDIEGNSFVISLNMEAQK